MRSAAVTVACELALDETAISADYILNALSRLRPTPACVSVVTPEQLRLTHEPIANCQRYNQLLCAIGKEITHATA